MKRFLLSLSLLAACGGATSNAQLKAAAPTFDDVVLAQNDTDNVEPAESAPADVSTSTALTATDCHPHLFARTHDFMARINRHFAKIMHHVEHAIAATSVTTDGESHVWEKVENGIDRKLTMTRTDNADGTATYTWTLELKSSAVTDFVKVAYGSVTQTEASANAGATVNERKGSATFDYTALQTVITTERATGRIAVDFDRIKDASKPGAGVKRTMTVSLNAFLPEEGDPHGPRTGSYTHVAEPGVGGLLTFADSVVLLCPTNTTSAAADLAAVARWYKASDGAVHGRSDAQATGGQIPAGAKWEGVTCFQGATTTTPAEGYWMMKEEDAGGATVVGMADTLGTNPCDPVFGAVPSVSSSANDYSFSQPVSFPGQW